MKILLVILFVLLTTACFASIGPTELKICMKPQPVISEPEGLSALDVATMNYISDKPKKPGITKADLALILVASGLYLLVIIRNTV